MSEENVELVRGMHEHWARGDFAAGTDLIAPDFEYRQNPESVEPGVRRGPGVGDALRGIFEVYDDYRIEAEEFTDAGDNVLVRARALGTARGSGMNLDMNVFFVWTVRDGRLANTAVFGNRDQALEAAGLHA